MDIAENSKGAGLDSFGDSALLQGDAMTRSALAAAAMFLMSFFPAAGSEPCAPFFINVPEVFDIAVDESGLYFTSGGSLWRVPLGNGSPTPIGYLKDRSLMMITVDDTRIFVMVRSRTDGDSVLAIPKSGGVATELLRGITASAMAQDGDWLYILSPGTFARGRSNGDGAIVRVKKDGSKWERIATGLRMPMGLLLDGDRLYVSERGIDSSDTSGGVKWLPKGGGRTKRLAKVPLSMAMAQDRSNLYVATLGGEHQGSIHSVSKSDGNARELVDGIRFELILPLEVFDDSLYFGTMIDERRARIEAIDLDDGARRTVAEIEGGSPFIAVDRCGVYYSTSKGIERAGP